MPPPYVLEWSAPLTGTAPQQVTTETRKYDSAAVEQPLGNTTRLASSDLSLAAPTASTAPTAAESVQQHSESLARVC